MMQWMILPFKRYFDFQGRSRRLEFWMFALFNVIVYSVIGILIVATGSTADRLGAADPNDPASGVRRRHARGRVPGRVRRRGVDDPVSTAVAVRRLHDREMTGWWYLGFIILSAIPLLGLIASIAYIVVMALPGTPGPNKYGPSPKEHVTAETFE